MLPADLRGHPILGEYLHRYRADDEKPMSRKMVEDYFGQFEGYESIFISEETFCHDFMPSKRMATGGINRASRAAALLRSLPFDDIRIILTIRSHLSLLISTYTHYVHRHREHREFSDWLASEVAVGEVSWQPAIDSFVEKFDIENVSVLPFETVKQSGISGYAAEFLRMAGIDPSFLNLSVTEVQNPSPSMRAIELCRVINWNVKNPIKSEKVNNLLVKEFPVSEFGKFQPAQEILDRISATLSEDYDEVVHKYRSNRVHAAMAPQN
jgi:hypothetical protein